MIRSTYGRFSTLSVLVTAGGIALAGCGEKTYSVGDCVKVKQQVIDQKMKSVSCPSGDSGFSPRDPVYKVDEVIDGASGNCTPHGFGAVEFSDQPADKTYCLSFAR